MVEQVPADQVAASDEVIPERQQTASEWLDELFSDLPNKEGVLERIKDEFEGHFVLTAKDAQFVTEAQLCDMGIQVGIRNRITNHAAFKNKN